MSVFVVVCKLVLLLSLSPFFFIIVFLFSFPSFPWNENEMFPDKTRGTKRTRLIQSLDPRAKCHLFNFSHLFAILLLLLILVPLRLPFSISFSFSVPFLQTLAIHVTPRYKALLSIVKCSIFRFEKYTRNDDWRARKSGRGTKVDWKAIAPSFHQWKVQFPFSSSF